MGVSERLAAVGFCRKSKSPAIYTARLLPRLVTPEVNSRAFKFYFDLVTSKLSVLGKQKPRGLHRGAPDQTCHSKGKSIEKKQMRNLAVPHLTTWLVLRRQCSRAVHKHCLLFCREPTSGIEPLPSE